MSRSTEKHHPRIKRRNRWELGNPITYWVDAISLLAVLMTIGGATYDSWPSTHHSFRIHLLDSDQAAFITWEEGAKTTNYPSNVNGACATDEDMRGTSFSTFGALNPKSFFLARDHHQNICEIAGALTSPESPLTDTAQQIVHNFLQRHLLLTPESIHALCRKNYGACYDQNNNFTLLPAPNDYYGIFAIFHELGHQMTDVDGIKTHVIGDRELTLDQARFYIDDVAPRYSAEFIADIIGTILVRWYFAIEPGSAQAEKFLPPYITILNTKQLRLHSGVPETYEEIETYFTTGVDRLIAQDPQAGFTFINEWAQVDDTPEGRQHIENILRMLDAAYEPGTTNTTHGGIEVIENMNSMYQRTSRLALGIYKNGLAKPRE